MNNIAALLIVLLAVPAYSGIPAVTQPGGGLSSVVNDTTPQLGGALDVNGNPITSSSDGDIILIPDGTGQVVVIAPFVAVGSATVTRGLRVGETLSAQAIHSSDTVTAKTAVSAAYYQLNGSTIIHNNGTAGNIFLGVQAGAAASQGVSNSNAGVGDQALKAIVNGTRNAALGFQAGAGANSTSNDNVFIGAFTSLAAGLKSRNVIIGKEAGENTSTGNDNTFLGFQAGRTNCTTGDDNIMVGSGMTCSVAGASNELNIGNVITSLDHTTKEVNFGGFQGPTASTISTGGRWTQHVEADCLSQTPDAFGQLCFDANGFYISSGTSLGQFQASKFNASHGIIDVSTTALVTTIIATQNVFVVPMGTSTIDTEFSMNFDSPDQHQLRYIGGPTKHFECILSGAINMGASATFHARLTINTDPTTNETIEHSTPMSATNTSEFIPFTVHRFVELANNDLVTPMFGNTTGTADADVTYTMTCTTL